MSNNEELGFNYIVGAYSISLDKDNFCCFFDDIDDAYHAGKVYAEEKESDSFYIGKTVHPVSKIGEYKQNKELVADFIIAKLNDMISDELQLQGEIALAIDNNQKNEIANLIFDYCSSRLPALYLAINDIDKYVKIDSVDGEESCFVKEVIGEQN